MVNVLLARVGLEFGTLEETEKEFVHDLQVRPTGLVRRLVLLLVSFARRLVGDGGKRSKNVERDHGDDLRVDGLGETALGDAYVVDNLVQASSLDLLALEIGDRIHEVENDAALFQLFNKQLLLLLSRRI